jgi:hypothetical protein
VRGACACVRAVRLCRRFDVLTRRTRRVRLGRGGDHREAQKWFMLAGALDDLANRVLMPAIDRGRAAHAKWAAARVATANAPRITAAAADETR